MEKKSLGRGLEDISDIFLSRREERPPDKILNGFSPVKIREESCESCMNIMRSHTGEQKCKIFSQDHERYGVPYIESIIPTYGNFCVYFHAASPGSADNSIQEGINDARIQGTECEVEETIRIGKKIVYPNNNGSQKNMKKTLFEYLEEGYKIQNIELRKTYTVSEPRKKEKMDVEVIMCVKDT